MLFLPHSCLNWIAAAWSDCNGSKPDMCENMGADSPNTVKSPKPLLQVRLWNVETNECDVTLSGHKVRHPIGQACHRVDDPAAVSVQRCLWLARPTY